MGRELEQESHTWIKALSDRVQKQEMRELLERVQGLTQKFDKGLADSVLEVSIRAKKQIVGELRGDDSMCQALLEIMDPEINEIVGAATKDEARKLILRSIKSFRDLGIDDEQIKRMLVKNYELTSEEKGIGKSIGHIKYERVFVFA